MRPTTPAAAATVDPLTRRSIEIETASAFFSAIEERFDSEAAHEILRNVVETAAGCAAREWRARYPDPTLSDLWEVWQHLGGDGRLDMRLHELDDRRLCFGVERCAYAELYRSLGLEELGAAFSCRRDEPFAKAFLPGVSVEQSTTILEGADSCTFTYTLEDR